MDEDHLQAIRARNEAWAGREFDMRQAPIAVGDRHDLLAEVDRLQVALQQIVDETTDRIAFARAKGALGDHLDHLADRA